MTNEELKAMLDAQFASFKAELPKGITEEELTVKLDAFKASLPTVVGVTKEEIEKMFDAHKEVIGKELADKLKNKTEVAVDFKSQVIDGIMESFKESGVNTFADLKKVGRFEYEVKVDNQITTAAQSDLTSRTREVSDVRFPKLRPTAFMGKVRMETLEQDKSQLMWTVGVYTSNGGYATEFTAITNGNAATATAKFRKLAKVGARQVVTEETFEDLSQFAARIYDKLIETTTLFFDTEVWSGDGDDSTAPLHVYGIKNKGVTAFDSASAIKVEKPNIADLADACATQAEVAQYACDTVWMSPRVANKLRRTKDTTGQYIINKLVTGELVMGGLTVETNTVFSDTELLVGAKNAIQLWIKRGLSVEVDRVASTDSWVYYMYMRGQCLVEDEDMKSLIYVSDIDTALAAITLV